MLPAAKSQVGPSPNESHRHILNMRNRLITVTMVLMFFSVQDSLQNDAPDNEGRKFIFAFGSNYPNTGGALKVFVTTRVNNDVKFSYTYGNVTKEGSVRAGKVFSYTIPDSYRMNVMKASVSIEKKAQSIISTEDIVVYACNKQVQSTDSFMVLPIDVLGTQYVVPAWQTTNSQTGGSMINIAATEDDTTVIIVLNGTQLVPPFTLHKNEVFQYLAEKKLLTVEERVLLIKGLLKIPKDPDVTGAYILSNKPIAVMSGNRRTDVHMGKARLSSDHLVEMIPPINTLGREFLTSNTFERRGDIYRIIGAKANTALNIHRSSNGINITKTLNFIGDFVTLESGEDEVLHIFTDGPVLVAQYTQSNGIDRAASDPMMSIVTPKEQYGNYYTFTSPTDGYGKEFRNYVNIVIKSADVDGLLLDGSPINDTLQLLNISIGSNIAENCWAQDVWQQISSSGYSARTLAVVHGTHSIYHKNPTTVFNALMYGQIQLESYGLPAGARMATIGDYCTKSRSSAGDGIDNDCDNRVDEELPNWQDDDGDGLVDEDIALGLSQSTQPASTSLVPEEILTTSTATPSVVTAAPTASTSSQPQTTNSCTDTPTQTKKFYCPDKVTALTTPLNGLATFQLSCGDQDHILLLPIGRHPYIIKSSGQICNITLNAEDFRVRHTLELVAEYTVDCRLVKSPVTWASLRDRAQLKYATIESLCGPVCKRPSDNVRPILSCDGRNNLKIRWPTDLTFTADVIGVPTNISQALEYEIRNQGIMMEAVVFGVSPPIVFPRKAANGGYTSIALSTSCINGLTYSGVDRRCF